MFDSKKFLSDVSHEPGVYRMYDEIRLFMWAKRKILKSAFPAIFEKT